jgi:hypothetical protein
MFNYFKILLITLSITAAISSNAPISANTVGTIEGSKSSWYAVIAADKGKKLYVKGDIFYSNEDPSKGLRILDIKQDALILEDVASKNGVIVKSGEAIPIKGAGMVFEKTVESSVLEYNYNKTEKKVTKNQLEDFTVQSIEKKKIVLEKDYNKSFQPESLSAREKEVFNTPRDRDSDKKIILTALFDEIETKKIGEDVWALRRTSAEPALHNAGSALVSAIKGVEPRYRFGEGPSLKFNTDLGTLIINRDGFLIQNIAVASLTEKFGIRQGDIIKNINGYSVNSLLGVYRVYENVASDKSTKLLSIDIDRGGKIKTLVYKIR